jgi:predicted Fe-Mo cluster-binding NifX family protein
VLDTAAKLLILETLDQRNISRTEAFLNEQEISKRCFCIQNLGIDVLICGAVSRPFSDILAAAGINIIPGISGAVEEIVAAYFGGTLNQAKFLMPGCRHIQASTGHKLPPLTKLSGRASRKK